MMASDDHSEGRRTPEIERADSAVREREYPYARKAALSGFLGSALEFYDFFIYGSAAALVFGRLFFTGDSSTAALLSLSTLGVAYVTRPVGAVMWGHLGDRLGRKRTLFSTLVLMGVATVLIGCLPTYSQVGILAPVLLIALRLLQGLSAGGESPGSGIFGLEHAPDSRRSFFTSFTLGGSTFGIVLGTVIFIPLTMMSRDDLYSWGWRLPFWLSILVTGVAFFIRRSLPEPEVVAEEVDRKMKPTSPIPFVELLRGHWPVMVGCVLSSLGAVVITIVNIFALSYATRVIGIPAATMLVVVTVANLTGVATIPLFGWIADRIGRRPVFMCGTVGSVVMVFVFFNAIGTRNIAIVYFSGIVLLGLFYAAVAGVSPALIAEQFPVKIRFSGMAISVMIGQLATGAAPGIAVALTSGDPSKWAPVAWMNAGFGALALLGAIILRETYKVPTLTLPGGRVKPIQWSPSSNSAWRAKWKK